MHNHNRAYCSSALILYLAAVDRAENKRSYEIHGQMIRKAKAWFRPPAQMLLQGLIGVSWEIHRKDVATENALHVIDFRTTRTVE